MAEYDFSDFGGIDPEPAPGMGGGAPPPGFGDEEEEEIGSRGGLVKRLFPIVTPIVTLLVGAGGAAVFFLFIMPPPEPEVVMPEEVTQEVLPSGVPEPIPASGEVMIMELKGTAVNLRGGGGGRVLRIKVNLQADVQYEPILEERKAMLQDAIIGLASDYTYADLEGLDGKNRLRDELLGRFNSLLEGEVRVDRIYFTEFVVQ